MMNDKPFDDLLVAYFDGEISEQELAELHEAVHGSERLRRRFQEETRLHVLLRENLAEQVELQSLCKTMTPPVTGIFQSQHRLAFAAVAAMLIFSLTIGYWFYRSGLDSIPVMGVCMRVSGGSDLSVQRGDQHFRATPDFQLLVGDQVTCDAQTQAMLRLSDGSILSMEPGAQLMLVSDSPKVRLQQGEAFFEIAPRSVGRPAFEVRTGHSTVAVMGTVFSLVASGHTELKVYEGSVTLTRNSDQATVNVASQQMATTENLDVKELSLPTMEILRLLPTDDLTLDRGQPEIKFKRLKVEGQRRIVYLRFMVPDVKEIHSARLRLTQDVDAGSGTLRFFVGDHSDWSEDSLTEADAPKPLTELAQHRGVVGRGQVVDVDVSAAMQDPGPITVILTLDKAGEDDIWFGSRESETPPQLILTRLQ